MPQGAAWEREYKNPQFLTKDAEPQIDTKRFLRFLESKQGLALEGLRVLDLGSGTGRNANYIAKLGNSVEGLEISATAVRLAQERAKALGVDAHFRVADMGVKYPFADQSFEVVIDVTSSNSLNEKEREVYLNEIMRVLKPGGYLFVKALCKDGDQNAKKLLKINPGKEYDTYINKDLGLVERVFSQEDFRTLYGRYFKILKLSKKTNYTRFKGQSYKRNFWLAYMQKSE